MTGTQALLISGQISLPVSVSAVAAAAGIKVIDYAAFRAQFENSLDDICRMVSYAGFSMLADGRMVAVLNRSAMLRSTPQVDRRTRSRTPAVRTHHRSAHTAHSAAGARSRRFRRGAPGAADRAAFLRGVLRNGNRKAVRDIQAGGGIPLSGAFAASARAGRGIPARSQERAVLTGLHFPENRRTARTLLKIRAVHRELYSIKIPPRRL